MYGSSSLSVYQSGKILHFKETYHFFTLVKLFNEINNVFSCHKLLKFLTFDSSYFNKKLRNWQNYHSYNTRFVNQNNINVPLYTRSKFQNLLLYKSIGLWNNLSYEIKSWHCINRIMNKFRKHHLLNKLYWNEKSVSFSLKHFFHSYISLIEKYINYVLVFITLNYLLAFLPHYLNLSTTE